MKYLNITVLIFSLFLMMPQSSYVGDNVNANMILAKKLIRNFLPSMAIIDENDLETVKNGDFNGDGITDLAVVFLPVSEIRSKNKSKSTDVMEKFCQE